MNDKGSKFYYSKLTDGEKRVYDKICAAWLNFDPAVSICTDMGEEFSADTHKIMTAALFDNPVFFYVDRNYIILKNTPNYVQINFRYIYGKVEAENLWADVEAKINDFIKNNIKPEMSTLAKQIQIHRSMVGIMTASEPYDEECFSVIGAFLKRRCVCEGYAKAYKLLCDRVGIASIVVMGDAVRPDGTKEAHAWNITRINGVTAHTDASWDSRFGISSYDYFNLCDADISADHVFDRSLYPKCEPNKINYFYKNGLIACDEDELKRLIAEKSDKPYFSVKLLFPFSAERVWSMPFDIGEVRYNPMQNIISYTKAMIE